ncbi:MAG: hypothetical protein DHS20C15_31360 [Planctomycetota bacterium]|nr:MAG: hypothetical protein DHS20C15_31360 [Planctomycetota bacterium]
MKINKLRSSRPFGAILLSVSWFVIALLKVTGASEGEFPHARLESQWEWARAGSPIHLVATLVELLLAIGLILPNVRFAAWGSLLWCSLLSCSLAVMAVSGKSLNACGCLGALDVSQASRAGLLGGLTLLSAAVILGLRQVPEA